LAGLMRLDELAGRDATRAAVTIQANRPQR
jgi:hypothetical protein